MKRTTTSRAGVSAALVAGLLVLAACGSDDTPAADSTPADSSSDSTAGTTTDTSGDATIDSTVAHPTVDSLPAGPVTELSVTVIEPGTGPESVAGDTVVVDYTGVRSADGTEFDNSYDYGQPLAVGPLGNSGVIDGWDQGLVGVQAGETLQLDIPSALAYGDSPQGEIIQAGDDLTFIVEVNAVIPGTTADQQPDVTVEPTEGASSGSTEVTTTDLVVGTGAEAAEGSNVAVQYMAFSGADGALLDSGWESGTPLVFTIGDNTYLQGFDQGATGMKVGGRREVVIPGEVAFGPEGSEDLGVPAGADLIMVFDLIAIY